MKALVIGGNQFFGRHLVDKLLADGAKVTLLNHGIHPDPFGATVERIKCDRRQTEALSAAVKKRVFDVVFDQVCFDANDARAACRVFNGLTPLYVFTSSLSVYPLGADLTEKAFEPKQHRFTKVVEVTQDYAEAKRQAESAFFNDARFKVIAARFPIVLGLDDYTSRLEFHIVGVDRGEMIRFPNFEARMGFVESKEAGHMLKFLAGTRHSGPVNCSSIDAISMRDLITWIEQATGAKAKIATGAEKGEVSPYGVAGDWFSRTDVMQALGFPPRALAAWLPDLIRAMVEKRRKQKERTI